MLYRTWTTIALIFILATTGIATETALVRFHRPSGEFIQNARNSRMDIAAIVPGRYIDLVVSMHELSRLDRGYGSVQVLETTGGMRDRFRDSRTMPGYQTYDEMLARLQSFQNKYPSLCKLYDIGDSRGKQYTMDPYKTYKHDIWAMKVTANPDVKTDRPRLLFMAEHHAREAASLEVCMAVLEHFITRYNTDPVVTDRLNSCELWFVPLVNPDGHKIAVSGLNTFWRKNMRDNNGDSQINAGPNNGLWDGVDLNRNYAYKWGGAGTSTEQDDELYCGPNALSEPEADAVRKLMQDNHFVASISYHLYSELVLWPYGLKNAKAPDEDAMADLGGRIASKLPRLDGSGTYTPQNASALYETTGGSEDFGYETYGIFGYTVELFNGSFWPGETEVETLKKHNIPAAMELVNRTTYATITGTVSSGGHSAKPVEAIVYVKEIDDTVANKTSWRAPYASDPEFGRYYRILMPGSYTVTFKPKSGILHDTTFQNVPVHPDKPTVLNVAYNQGSPILTGAPARCRGLFIHMTTGNRGQITITTTEAFSSLEMYSLRGGKVAAFSAISPGTTIVRSATAIPAGLYAIRMTGARGTRTMHHPLTR